NNEAVGEAIGDHCGQHVASLKRQIELLEREVNQLRAHVALARGLEELQSEIAAAKSQIPELPKVVERLEAGQSRLRREVAATKEKIGNLRVDTSQINYNLTEMAKARVVDKTKLDELRQATEATAAKVDTLFPMHEIHPAAGAALRHAADDMLKDSRTLFSFDPSMFEAAQTQPAAAGLNTAEVATGTRAHRRSD